MTETNPRKVGRPAEYTDSELLTCYDAVIADGDAPEAIPIRAKLIELFQVSPKINTGSLKREIGEITARRTREHEDDLIAALPDSLREAAATFGRDCSRLMEVTLGKGHAVAQERLAAARAASEIDAGAFRDSLRSRDEIIADLHHREAEALTRNDALTAEIDRLRELTTDLEAQLLQRSAQADLVKALEAAVRSGAANAR